MALKLRPYTPEDFDALFEIDQECFPRGIAYPRRELRRYLQLPGAHCIVAQSGRAIAGFCLTIRQGIFGYVITMDVRARYRRKGAGAALLAAAEQNLRENGVGVSGLETAVDNEGTVAFWKNQGYLPRAIRKNYYPGRRDAYTMTKDLRISDSK